ncbi:uncharacterized protein LOC115443320 isoform X2 [Manduca sexta]|uniref:Uncharacterized protein n=2 Tax=Manduca sexta TaxID=7130 RepID=A0A921Z2Z5_MANSE|nr:uncharacterized protein LOC115443320 isoform X2 [Manduca sexta]KAG6449835.1 hypothetical protein O3G_MSEX006271 [Manduca sexta]
MGAYIEAHFEVYFSEPPAKMIGGIFVLSLFAFAYAQVPYADFADKIDDAVKQLEDQILSMAGNIPNITDSRRHYAVLLTHIALVAASMAADGGHAE